MQTVASLELERTLVGPDERIGELRYLSRPHGPRAVAVANDGVFVGLLDCRVALYRDPSMLVRDVMDVPEMQFEWDTPVRRVAQEFLTYDLDFAPIFRGDEFLGLVTTPMLLREVGRSWDPLTGLGWSDRLREWGVARLREGQEITLLFVDLDSFGNYNKRYGHIVGDYVLQIIAAKLKDHCESGRDILVRYGGDEFAIGSLRSREDAEAFAEMLKRDMSGLRIEEQTEPISFSIGICGGRRTIERDQIHFAATMDNLINLASKDCMAQKARKGTRDRTAA